MKLGVDRLMGNCRFELICPLLQTYCVQQAGLLSWIRHGVPVEGAELLMQARIISQHANQRGWQSTLGMGSCILKL